MAYEQLSKAEELKLTIIENFIDYYFHDDKEKEAIKELAFNYVINDHINELSEIVSNKRILENW